jgi:hypothetical protein
MMTKIKFRVIMYTEILHIIVSQYKEFPKVILLSTSYSGDVRFGFKPGNRLS